MATTEQDKAVETTPKKVESLATDKIARERLLSEECYALTGIERHIVVGALFANKKTELTTDEVQAAVDKWLTSPVQED